MALRVKPRIEVKRARFSNTERSHVIQAARQPVLLDEKQANAVASRIELDLRIGASFTRMLSINLKPIINAVQELKVLSYGRNKPVWILEYQAHAISRHMPVSYTRIRRRAILSGAKLCAGSILEDTSWSHKRQHQSSIQLAEGTPV